MGDEADCGRQRMGGHGGIARAARRAADSADVAGRADAADGRIFHRGKIKQDPDGLNPRIIMLTSGGQRGDSERCREVGISAYLSKPVRQYELRETIHACQAWDRRRRVQLITRHSLQRIAPQRLRVLLAEDNADQPELTMRIFTKRGHTGRRWENGQQAVEALEKQSFDFVPDGRANARDGRFRSHGGDSAARRAGTGTHCRSSP